MKYTFKIYLDGYFSIQIKSQNVQKNKDNFNIVK